MKMGQKRPGPIWARELKINEKRQKEYDNHNWTSMFFISNDNFHAI